MEILNQLGINPAVMIAQAVNFFVLLGILSFFVYKPILKLLDERKNRIAKAEANAKLVEDKLARTDELTKKELQKAQQKSREIIAAAVESAKKEEEKLIAVGQEKVTKIVEAGRASIEKERIDATTQIKKEVAGIVLLATEKLLGRELRSTDNEKFVAAAIKEIESLKNG